MERIIDQIGTHGVSNYRKKKKKVVTMKEEKEKRCKNFDI